MRCRPRRSPAPPAHATRSARRTAAAFVALLMVATAGGLAPVAAQRPADPSFADLVARLSEPNGYFDSDNIITNEASYLEIASQLRAVGTRGGVYIGVGPDQNFSYIALIRPAVAFLVDVRRDNLLEHLLFKSLFDLSRNRLQFLCLLLGRPVPADLGPWTERSIDDLIAYLRATPADSASASAARRASDARIVSYGVPLDARDRAMIDRYRAQFVAEGLDTRYSSIGRNNRRNYPSFAQLIAATDRAGRQRSYLADDAAFQYVRAMQRSGRIIPLVGNVAGPRTIRAIGAYAREHGITVSAFYLSNVEQYLLGREGGFDAYAENVRSLPHDARSVIIRSYFGRFGSVRHPLYVPGSGGVSTSMIERMDSFNRAFAAGELATYQALVFDRYVTP